MNSVSHIPVPSADQETSVPTSTVNMLGWWTGDDPAGITSLAEAVRNIKKPVYLLAKDGECLVAQQGLAKLGPQQPADDALAIIAYAPAIAPGCLGDPSFCRDYNIRFPYMTGAMANGIASTRLVQAIADAGMLGSFGAAGLSLEVIEQALQELQNNPVVKPFCINLIYSPNEKGKEEATVDLFIRNGIKLIEASAYLGLTLPVVRYRVHGIHQDSANAIVTPNRIIAKASRIEVAQQWFSPPPDKILQQLLDNGAITGEQLELARQIPMAQDLTVEADSGGHTDNRPAITLLPTIIALRDRLQKQYAYSTPLRVGAAGGIATPASAAAALTMGAAYIVTGTINQACIESGTSDIVRKMLAEAQQADVAMAPAVDMFEMGVKLQVLKRGTMFAMRGNKLYEYYRAYNAIDEIPAAERQNLEQTIFRAPLKEIWQNTRTFFLQQDPGQVTRAEQDSKHKMALMFRWYLGLSSRWANAGEVSRQTDFQVWCGPAMGAFNEWCKGSYLQQPEHRTVVAVALNILYGAAVIARINMLRGQGVNLSAGVTTLDPVATETIENHLK